MGFRRAVRIAAPVSAGVLALAFLAGSATSAPTMRTHRLTLYSVATAEQFANNGDDRLRGGGTNPFGNFHDNSGTTKQAKGPFPGDEAIFQFAVFATPGLKQQRGTASYACAFNFDDAVQCDVHYALPQGSLFGTGAFDFAATSFALAITGGTGAYAGATGRLAVTPASRTAQKLAFALR